MPRKAIGKWLVITGIVAFVLMFMSVAVNLTDWISIPLVLLFLCATPAGIYHLGDGEDEPQIRY